MKKSINKLSLNKSTISNLSHSDLSNRPELVAQA
ncbi:MAG: class I lanthipeptide [Bacteroidetes bacterium]|nr:class I lanthipeptide [Bacteroidota bacterium]